MIYIGMDDTDNLASRGTGALARCVAADLARDYQVVGVIRHQLLRHPEVPCTKNNSSKGIMLNNGEETDLDALSARIRRLMLDDYQPGSDPGLCVTRHVPQEIITFGRRVQTELVSQAEARGLAACHGIYLEGLGGDEMGVIGALAAVGLSAGGQAGRYIQVGLCRELNGLQPVEAVLAAGIDAVETVAGEVVSSGLVQTDGLRPARRRGRVVAVVERRSEVWTPIRLD